MLDIHAHILPGVDDGATSWEEALAMARIAVQDGIRAMICTPHLDPEDNYKAALDKHTAIRLGLQQRLKEEGIELVLHAGAEWRLSPCLLDIVDEYGGLGGGRAFLFELSRFMPVKAAESFVVEAVHRGLRPVIAHPERHPWVDGKNFSELDRLCSAGCLLQLTAGSLTGEFDRGVRKSAEAMACRFSRHIVIASDAHRSTVRQPRLKAGYEALESLQRGLGDAALHRTYELLLP